MIKLSRVQFRLFSHIILRSTRQSNAKSIKNCIDNRYKQMLDFQALFKYILEGIAVAIAAFYIPQRAVSVKEVVMIALTAAAVFSILDHFSPSVAAGARQGGRFRNWFTAGWLGSRWQRGRC
jgi:K+-sensing histidine kinase KdpD